MSASQPVNTPQKGWWRRNAVGLVALAVLAPATVGVMFSTEFGGYISGRPSAPIEVAAEATADFAGASWSLESVRRIAADDPAGQEAGLPEGTDLVVVTTRVEPGELDEEGRSPGCIVRLDELDGAGGAVLRTWSDSAFSAIDHDTADDSSSYCDTELTTPYRLESIFLVPSDAGEHLALQVQVAAELPRYLHVAVTAPPAS
ncbi:hypothetical protein N1031_05440 [Herbiconiux moechotypicola]|uniref:hypothetical protein n=1 Tax=Herbiconiux moechotypicola TaxID=637393 RepID=UPI00217F1A12|nr:hypothetical protein [Herbiconiux moechotypicola]MCS5729199.1 hypothetical protein [Herbiconiux moechotypicola]